MKINVFLLYDGAIATDKLPILDKHYNWIQLQKKDVDTFAKLTGKIREFHPMCFVTINEKEWHTMFELPYSYRCRWINFSKVSDIYTMGVVNCCINAALSPRIAKDSPLFSVITSTYHSGDKIFKPWISLQKQTYREWEWIVLDDSTPGHDDVWNNLLKFRESDIRVSCYRDVQNSGFIGQMKQRAASLALGSYIVEIDHDDIIDDNLLEICASAIKAHPDADFLCSDWVDLFEDTETPFNYGDSYSFGYGSSINQWLRGKWHTVLANTSVNPETIRHIVGVPNHVRIWRREFYEKIGKHNPELPVVDDYELMLRTYLEAKKMVRIPKPLYYQFRNNGGNNFTFIRNSLIQHLTYRTQLVYEYKIQKMFKDRNIHDYVGLEKQPPRTVAWKNNSKFKYNSTMYTLFDPDIKDTTLSIIITTQGNNIDNLKTAIRSVIAQSYTDWILYIIGGESEILVDVMDDFAKEAPKLCSEGKIRWWNMSSKENKAILKNYALRMLIHTRLVGYLDGDTDKYITSNVIQGNMDKIKDKKYINDKVLIHDISLVHEHGDWLENENIETFMKKMKL